MALREKGGDDGRPLVLGPADPLKSPLRAHRIVQLRTKTSYDEADRRITA